VQFFSNLDSGFRERGAHPQLILRGVASMAKKKNLAPSEERLLEIADLDQIVGGAAATTQQYDTAKQDILNTINNTDISNAIAAEAASIASAPTSATTITAAITSIESHATADNVSQVAALAALDAATYGNAKINGTDAVGTALSQALTSGSGESDMAQLAANGINPTTLVAEVGQAVQILALGSSNQNTALGLQTNAATDWVEAKLEVAAGIASSTYTVDAEQATVGAAIAAIHLNSAQSVTDMATAQTDLTAASNASALQSYLNVQHQGEVAEGTAIDSVITALGGNLSTIEQDAAALQGLTGAAAQNVIAAAEHAAGLPNELTLVALDLFAQGNATVQQALSTEYTSGTLETNLAQAVATGALTGDQAVQTLNLIVGDLAQNSVNASTVPQLEQGFAVATADVALANAAGALATADTLAAAEAGSGYAPSATLSASDTHQAELAASLQTLINTNYSGQVALAGELTAIINEVGGNAATYIADGANIIANPSLAAQYISAIESAAEKAEASATPGSSSGAFSADAALNLLAIYSHGNPTVLNEIETRLVNGTAETDLANLVALGAIPASQAVSILTQMVDTLAANSPNNSVTLTGADGQSIMVDRTSAENWALGQLATYALPMQSNLATEGIDNLPAGLFLTGSLVSAEKTAAQDLAESVNLASLVALLEGADAEQVVAGLSVDTAWATSAASADAAAVIAAGTSMVQSGYGPEPQVSAAAQAQANAIEATADQRELANMTLAQQIMQANLSSVWSQTIGSGQDAAIAAVQAAGQEFYQNFAQPVGEFAYGAGELGYGVGEDALDEFGITSSFQSAEVFGQDPNLSNFVTFAINTGLIVAPIPPQINLIDLGLQGMAALMQESVVSDVIGTHASGDIATACQVLHDGLSGAMNLFGDGVQMAGQAAVQLSTDALQVGENAFSLEKDLFSGNLGALGGDATALFSSLGQGLKDLFYLPLSDDVAELGNFVGVVGGIEKDFMNNADFASAVHAISSEAQSLVTDIGNLLPSSVDNAISDAWNEAKNILSTGASDVENWADDVGDAIASIY
jgi:hypothetical protein